MVKLCSLADGVRGTLEATNSKGVPLLFSAPSVLKTMNIIFTNSSLTSHNQRGNHRNGYGCTRRLASSGRQDKYENFFFVVDLHAITVPQDPKLLKASVVNTVATYLAAGIDPEKSKVFVQVLQRLLLLLLLLSLLLLLLLCRKTSSCSRRQS